MSCAAKTGPLGAVNPYGMLAARLAASATELSMHNVYLATMMGAIISTSLASRVFAVGALGSGGRRLLRARSLSRVLAARLRKARDRWVAARLANCERRAAAQSRGRTAARAASR
jgi:hypothetical protein